MSGFLVAKRAPGGVHLHCRCCADQTTLSLGSVKAFSALGDYIWLHRHADKSDAAAS